MSLSGSMPGPRKNQCRICSKFDAYSVFVKCSECNQYYHPKCLRLSQLAQKTISTKADSWRCNRCRKCPVCKRKTAGIKTPILTCSKCDDSFHPNCLSGKKTEETEFWFCAKCKPTKVSPRRTAELEPIRIGISPVKVGNAVRSPSLRSPPPVQVVSPKTRGTAIMESRKRINERLKNDPEYDTYEPDEKEAKIEHLTTPMDYDLFLKAKCLARKDAEQSSPVRQIECVKLGSFELKTWYPSPFPDYLATCHKIYVCEFCLKALQSQTLFRRHAAKCVWRHPAGNEIYRKDSISFWEIDGKYSKVYCQNLCLLAKLFIDHKTLYFDVEPFLFYVMTVVDANGCHMVGYFSKEKESLMNCNLSCILTLPSYQRKGYGRLLIDFSYLLSKVEDRIGSPEHPLSDLGLLTYRNYWKDAILRRLVRDDIDGKTHIAIKDLSSETGIHPNDIVSTLQLMGMIKNWKGRYVVHKRADVLAEFKKNMRKSAAKRIEIEQKALKWLPTEEEDSES